MTMAAQIKQKGMAKEALWYKDAVIYQLHVKSFFDSNGDGIGDFPGLVSKLAYIAGLGANAIWLLPFYPSPRRDDGYDISAYRDVHPDYGTLADFRHFVREAHAHKIRIIVERPQAQRRFRDGRTITDPIARWGFGVEGLFCGSQSRD